MDAAIKHFEDGELKQLQAAYQNNANKDRFAYVALKFGQAFDKKCPEGIPLAVLMARVSERPKADHDAASAPLVPSPPEKFYLDIDSTIMIKLGFAALVLYAVYRRFHRS